MGERILCSVVIVITLIKIMSEAETELRQRRNLDSQEIEEPIIQDQNDVEALDVDTYTTRKSIAHGVFDLTFFTRNATLLKNLLYQEGKSSYFEFLVTILIITLILELISGVITVILARSKASQKNNGPRLTKLNNASVILVFINSALNIIINVFALPETNTKVE